MPEWLIRVFEVIDHNYRLQGAVINVLIHYVLGMNDAQRVTKTYIDAVASNMLVKGVDSFERAVSYVREQVRIEQDKEARRAGGGTTSAPRRNGGGNAAASKGRRKPLIPIMPDTPHGAPLTAEEMEEIRQMARKLDGKST